MSTLSASQLPLAPLGAGDLIDRAVRLYRRHLFVLIRTAAPPVIIATGGWIVFSLTFKRVFLSQGGTELALYILLSLTSLVVTFGGYLLTLVVLGGASRTLVAHLLRNDPVTARATYKAVRTRFWGLFAASLIVLIWISIAFVAVFLLWYILISVFTFVSLLLATATFVSFAVVFGIVAGILDTLLAIWLFFFIVARVAYVPQVLLVEGKGVFASFSRSFSLARGNVRRLIAMTIFTTFATYSALMILLIPLGWYGYLAGVDPFNSANWPAWYAVAYNVLAPLSSILLTPVWMLGLSLLYVDERVRHEGYDIELMAARQLGELPSVDVTSPLGTALSSTERTPPAPPGPRPSSRILDLS
ncbi:MAG TPA: hypothetical protein VFI57_11890 [Pyrinomonadaceae bacterium]|nr:hypothetical protein [Pyrinomonadaceae bacterium]